MLVLIFKFNRFWSFILAITSNVQEGINLLWVLLSNLIFDILGIILRIITLFILSIIVFRNSLNLRFFLKIEFTLSFIL